MKRRFVFLMIVALALLVPGLTGCDHNSSVGVEYDASCTPDCTGKSCGSDGCGGSCTGTCDPGWTCDANDGQCHCSGEDDAAFCESKGVTCGKATGTDRCGADRGEVNCDRCALPQTCNQATATCECIPAPDAQLCADLDKQCGTLATTDNCLADRQIDCGTCQPGYLCEAATNLCKRCAPESDAALCRRLGRTCGNYTGPDKCNNQRIAFCGQCDPGQECSPLGSCVACTPVNDADFCTAYGAQCGTISGIDNCDQNRTVDCGACADHGSCDAHHKCQPCVPDLDTVFCDNHQRDCGPLSADDNCGVARAVHECGPCPGALDHCDSATGTCVSCVPETDAALCAYYFKDCGTPSLTDRCGQTRHPSCGSASCAGALTCQTNGVCGNGTNPTNDTCDHPERLVFDSATGIATATGDMTNATGDYEGSCGGSGNDLVYAFSLTQPMNVDVTVTPVSSGSWHAVYVRQSCTSATDLSCAYAPFPSAAAKVKLRGLGAGDYFVIVDGYSGSGGAFTLSVTATPRPPPPPNDTCATPEVLAFVGNVATATGDTTNAMNDYADSCGASSTLDGGDLVYKFTLANPAMVLAKVTRGSGRYFPAVQLLSSCPSGGTALACGVQHGGVASVGSPNLAAGDYYLVVDGTTGSYGDFTLEVTTAAPQTNDQCAGAAPIALIPIAGTTNDLSGSVTGDTSFATDDYTSSCNSTSSGNDLVYSFTLPTGVVVYDVQALLESTPGGTLAPNVYLRTDCPPNGVEKGCDYSYSAGSSAIVSAHRLGAGTYFAFVDGASSAANGPFTLVVTATESPPAPLNDVCARATNLTIDPATGVARVADSTANATDDYQGSCSDSSTSPHSGSDMVYVVTTSKTTNLAARVRRNASTSASFRPAVYIQTTCGSAATDLACGNADYSGPATATATNAPAGTYYIVVDGIDGTSGDFTLEVITYSALTNDSCSSATAMRFNASGDFFDRGDLCAMSNDAQSVTGGSCAWSSGYGNDVVYQFTLTQPKNLTVTFDSGQAWTSEVYLRSGTCRTGTQLMCSSVDNGAPNVLTVKNLAAGTYFLFLDNDWSSDCGLFTMTAHLVDPPPVPSNDTCAAAESIALSSPGVGSATGTTESASDDSVGSCGPNLGGGDVVYSFTLTQTQALDIQVSPHAGSDLVPTVYLTSSSCAPGSIATNELFCRSAWATGSTVELQLARVAQGTYYLIVDSADHNATGAFDVSIAATNPSAAAANDLCAGATALPAFDPVTGRASITGNTADGDNDYTSNCASTPRALNGPDLVYQFTLGAEARVTATVTADAATAPSYKPAISLRRGSCLASDEVVCATDSATAHTGSASVTQSLTAGTWYVFVDGLDGTYGGFTLEVSKWSSTTTPVVPGDSCGNAIALSFSSSTGIATATGDLNLGGTVTNDYASTCQDWWYGPDLVYSMSFATDKVVSVELVGQGQLYPNVYLRAACDSAKTELGCGYSWSSGATVSFTTPRLTAGTYYLFVDTFNSNNADTFTLTVTAADPVNPPPANDACRAPTALTLDPVTNSVRVTGDTRDALNDYAAAAGSSCGGNSAPLTGGDVVYSVSVPQGATLAAALTRDATTPGYEPAVYVQSTCGSALAVHQLACNTSTAATAAVMVSNLTAGTYYLVVDGQTGSGGLFALEVSVRTAPMTTNTTCATAEALTFATVSPGVEVAQAIGDTSVGASQSQGLQQGSQSCASAGSEVYYSFTTTATKDLFIDVTRLSANYAPAFYVRAACSDPASQVACNYNCCGSLNVAKLKLPAGDWIIVGDSAWNGNEGQFLMKVTLSDPPPPPANDTCAGAQSLVLPASGQPALTLTNVSTMSASDDYVGGCQTAGTTLDGPDLVYTFTLATATRVEVAVTPSAATPNYLPAVYLRPTCATVDNDLCRYASWSGNAVNLAASLKAGTYYLIVDGQGGTFGAFDLSISTDDTRYVAGDHCINATSLDALFVPGSHPNEVVATVSDDTSRATNDGDGSCNTYTGSDFVYRFTVLRDSFVQIDVAPDGAMTSAYSPEPYLRASDCTDSTAEVYCQATYSGSPLSAPLYHVQPGTYYLFIDSYGSSANGPFTATVSVRDTPLPPLNDECRGAVALNFVPSGGGTATAASLTNEDSSFATNDTGGSCHASTGNDLVYQVTVTGSDKSFTATVIPDASAPALKPVIYLRTVCDQSSDLMEVACGKSGLVGGGPNPASIAVNSLPVGTYYLYVDSHRVDAMDPAGGKFTLTATLDAPIVGPGNDSCAFATQIALTGQAPSTTTLTGQSTIGAVDNTEGSCAGLRGPDVVYSFTLTDPAQVTVTATPDPGFYPAIYLRRGCGSPDAGNELGCASSSSAATAQEVTRAYLRPGTYYVWVDAGTSTAANASGLFQLEVTLTVPTQSPLPNDVCSGAVSLVPGAAALNGDGINALLDYPTPGTVWSPACRSSWNRPSAPDLVYTYTPTTSGSFTVAVDAQGWDALLWYNSGTCGDASTCGAIHDQSNPESITVNGVAGTTYYFYVSAYSSSVTVGNFTIWLN